MRQMKRIVPFGALLVVFLGGCQTAELATCGARASHRDVPKIQEDDEGYYNADAITPAQREAFVDCGTTQASVSARVSDCAAKNGVTATWDGTKRGTHCEPVWKLVTRQGANKEVWLDTRTELLWSSRVTPPSAGDNWCRASGNAEAGDPSSLCNTAAFQPEYPVAESECAEPAGARPVPGWCSNRRTYPSSEGCTAAGGTWTANNENFASGTYSAAKGGMGARSGNIRVLWRLPTRWDYQQADSDGLRTVMPDMRIFSNGYEWSASLYSPGRDEAWIYYGRKGVGAVSRNSNSSVRCVGHVE
jgi:hypothetical protein